MKLRLLDLFSGIGGFSLGLERSGYFETVAFCEIEPYCRKVLAKHWPKVPCYDDIRTLTADRLKADGIAVDAICGGFPCQDISNAGHRAGIEGERSGLWSEYARLIGELRPRFVIVENVAALLGRGLDRVLGDLASFGFDAEWHCIPASAVGAPHIRDRIWIIAHPRQDAWLYQFFDQDNGTEGTRGGSSERCKNWIMSELGQENASVCGQWNDRPEHRGVDYGFSEWLHRNGALGNAVVPQIPEIIGRAIGGTL